MNSAFQESDVILWQFSRATYYLLGAQRFLLVPVCHLRGEEAHLFLLVSSSLCNLRATSDKEFVFEGILLIRVGFECQELWNIEYDTEHCLCKNRAMLAANDSQRSDVDTEKT